MFVYSPAELRLLIRIDVTVPRSVRKTIFSLRLWQPARQRLHSQRSLRAVPGRRARTESADELGLSVGCVNARSVANKTATLCRTVADECYDAFVISETWHERSGSTTLKRATPPGYQCIDAARPISSDAAVHTVDYQNHGGLAIIYRDAVKLRKKRLDVDVSTFEFLLGYASTNVGQFVLLAVYRPGSRALSELFFDELSAVFEQLMTYGCPVIVCGDFNIHVDDKRDIYTVRLTELLQSFGCVQHVMEPTHNVGHTLDLVITRS